ncbi:porin family protein [Paenimyroides tangerinum]|uniref:Porin family protein n=1 Tax=Paenimyroides tangerinum TaxID=2488728 RepID=A0A3P3W713_9FLAO|nr:outer membrane beta-barrel protein [Paenimyroides tangerinum]RRJ90077.1 porin family protein [Paenimyroides tangerinum]
MNKKIIVISLLATFATKAQIKKKNDIELSASLGLASSNYYGDISLHNNQSIYTPTYGVRADFYSNNRWSFLLGLEYRTFGSKIKSEHFVNGYIYSNSITEKLNYIHIPFNANWHFGSDRNWNLNFGPVLSYLQAVSINKQKSDMTGIRDTQVGFGFGIGYKFKITEQISLGIEHQEYISFFSNIHKTQYTPFIGNVGGSFNVRFIYNLGSKKLHQE